jgi:hypothetical protein
MAGNKKNDFYFVIADGLRFGSARSANSCAPMATLTIANMAPKMICAMPSVKTSRKPH